METLQCTLQCSTLQIVTQGCTNNKCKKVLAELNSVRTFTTLNCVKVIAERRSSNFNGLRSDEAVVRERMKDT